MNFIEKNAHKILFRLVENSIVQAVGERVQQITGLEPNDINDAVEYLKEIGAIKVFKALGTAPYDFYEVMVDSRGKYLYYEIKEQEEQQKTKMTEINAVFPSKPLNPVGSPYGFTENDWLTVELQKEKEQVLYVVLGIQFKSECYNTECLKNNIKNLFQKCVQQYGTEYPDKNIFLHFEPLTAGLGGHLFNQIARDIIGADIAIFETSDLNPNVMIEMGVALTWGVMVLPIKKKGCPETPSDISGQTWTEYEDSASIILDKEFDKKLFKMVERAIAVKGRNFK